MNFDFSFVAFQCSGSIVIIFEKMPDLKKTLSYTWVKKSLGGTPKSFGGGVWHKPLNLYPRSDQNL